MASYEYLDEERKKLWLEINDLKDAVNKKTSDYEKEAKQASKKCSEFRNRSQEAKESVSDALAEAESKLKKLQTNYAEVELKLSESEKISTRAFEHSENINSVISKSEMISELFENKEQLSEKLESLSEILAQGQDSSNKINTLYNSIMKRKKEFDELFYEINGYEETDEAGEETHVNGLKDDLYETFNTLNDDLEELKKSLSTLKSDTSNNYDKFLDEEREKFKQLSDEWSEEYTQLTQKVKDLLPEALTAGLSYAYSEKRIDEIKNGKWFNRTFSAAIFGLVVVSLLPFFINIHLLQEGKSLEAVIYDMPRLVVAILPLYVPFLWLAYSANKKANLSKRLVEEYTHKEVLSKTYEGLSSQIDGLQDSDITAELKTKLLFNILDVSSENPGKLISDYNKADHPLMDALDKSSKLSDAVNSLAKIPGFSRLATILEKKSDEIIHKQRSKIEEGLDIIHKPEKDESQPV
jgi:uncharacterized coiled-coil DUF342 family protein